MASGDLGKDGEDEEGEEEDTTTTMTVTIALDSPQHDDGPDNAHIQDTFDNFLAILPPPSPSQLLANWPNSSPPQLFIRDLPAQMVHLLEIRLNPPVCASMRNWEFLAAHLGLSLDEIVGMRRNENPTSNLLRKFGHEPLRKLLELVGQAGRIDILLSLAPFASKVHRSSRNVPAAPLLPSTSTFSLASSSPSGACPSPPREPFLLLLHHEMVQSRDLRRFHRMLFKNLDKYGQENGVKLVDVDHCICGEDLLGSVQRHFERAWQVLMALSPDYAEEIGMVDSGREWVDQRTQLKRNLHQMTYQEVMYNRGENRRFRVILMQGTRPEHVPRGWPSNTLHYRFPDDFGDLCERVFERTERQNLE